jgi:3-deoxy-manno-octulosonate cytidylyltransferase (CMP-KDO synthetase)
MSKKISVVAVIPARYNSSRFPGKPLAPLLGKPMIQHVYERTRRASLISDVLVATDDERIGRAVEEFGGRVVMTSPDHLTGTDRVAEVALELDAEVVVNVQGDEPLISPQVIDQVVQTTLEDPSIQLATLAHRIEDSGDLENPDVVKVCVDEEGYALSFSRTGNVRDCEENKSGQLLRHIGIYVYRRPCLLSLAALKPTAQEWALGLEQLRPLEYGCRVKVVETEYVSLGVDRPQDLEKAERILQTQQERLS